jgi:hypothetical protein
MSSFAVLSPKALSRAVEHTLRIGVKTRIVPQLSQPSQFTELAPAVVGAHTQNKPLAIPTLNRLIRHDLRVAVPPPGRLSTGGEVFASIILQPRQLAFRKRRLQELSLAECRSCGGRLNPGRASFSLSPPASAVWSTRFLSDSSATRSLS